MARVQKGDFKLPLQDRQGDAEITAQYDAQGRDKGGKDEQMADVDTTHRQNSGVNPGILFHTHGIREDFRLVHVRMAMAEIYKPSQDV